MERSNHEISVEHFMAIIQDEVSRRRSADAPNDHVTNCDNRKKSTPFDWDRIAGNLNIADQNVQIGSRDFVMLRFGRSTRWFAKLVGRIVKYIARVITFQQILFNQSIVLVLRVIADGIRQLELSIDETDRKIDAQAENFDRKNEQIHAQIEAQNKLIRDHSAQIVDQTKLIGKIDKRVIAQNNEIAELKNMISYGMASISIQERLFDKLMDNIRDILPVKSEDRKIKEIIDESSHLWDSLYVRFEDRFRGSREDIKKRLSVYISILKKEGLGTEEYPVLDIACGRGEWLDLLRDNNLIGRGVDINRIAVDQCKKMNLNVVEEDVFTYFDRLPDSLYGAITAFHFIEHLPFNRLIQLMDESIRILKPGGIIIFETPNPENVMVSASTFYMDPTHRNPLPPQLIKFLAEERGFAETEIIKLNPFENKIKIEETSPLASRFNDYFYGPRDYAIVGFKKEMLSIKNLPE